MFPEKKKGGVWKEIEREVLICKIYSKHLVREPFLLKTFSSDFTRNNFYHKYAFCINMKRIRS